MQSRSAILCFAALVLLGGCSGMSTMERVGTGALVGAGVAGIAGASLGWGITAGVAGGLLSQTVD